MCIPEITVAIQTQTEMNSGELKSDANFMRSASHYWPYMYVYIDLYMYNCICICVYIIVNVHVYMCM